MAALQETGRGLTLETGETCRGQWWASGSVGWYHTSFVKGMGGDERQGNGAYIQFFISNSPNKQRATLEKTALRKWQRRGKRCDQRRLRKDRHGEGKRRAYPHSSVSCIWNMSRSICLSRLHEQPKGDIANCLVENSAKLKMALLNHINLLCALQEPTWIKASSNVRFPLICLLMPFLSVAFLRCVCTSPSLRLPAIPEGQADQTRVPDSFFPRGLSCCRHGPPHRDLSHIYRYVCLYVCSHGFTVGFTQDMIVSHIIYCTSFCPCK